MVDDIVQVGPALQKPSAGEQDRQRQECDQQPGNQRSIPGGQVDRVDVVVRYLGGKRAIKLPCRIVRAKRSAEGPGMQLALLAPESEALSLPQGWKEWVWYVDNL